MKLENPEFYLLSSPSYLLLTHINTPSLWGSSVHSQELYMKTCELIHTHSGHIEKWKTGDVTKFFQGDRTDSKSPECLISSPSFSVFFFFFKWRSNSLVEACQHHLNLAEPMKSYLPLAVDPVIRLCTPAMTGVNVKTGVPFLTLCPRSCWDTRFSVLRKGVWGSWQANSLPQQWCSDHLVPPWSDF